MTKTFDRKDIFSLLNAEDAKPYIGKFGYMSDNVQTLRKNIEENKRFKLHDIEDDYILPFKVCIKNDEIFGFGLFLPAEKVREEKEKTYRPFRNQDEIRKYFNRATTLGCPLNLQHKRTDERFTLMVTGFFENGLVLPLYGALTWEQLFDMFILYRNGKQQPFGVKVEE